MKRRNNMKGRRRFILDIAAGSTVALLGKFPTNILEHDPDLTRLTILHTNDVHSRIDPFPMDGSRNQGLGGAAKRAALIDKVRSREKNVLLFDSGDIFQGTPYFNFYGGELEMKLMSKMKYDAATIGNHDFDGGIDGLEKQLVHANFPFIISNYNMDNTCMKGKTLPYKVFDKGGIKVGVYGLGIELDGLVPKALYKDTEYQDPISNALKTESILKDLKCDYIVCLSHLGYKYGHSKISDHTLANKTHYTDLILGGHTHTFLKEPTKIKNQKGNLVVINQAGFAGILLGRLDIFFEKNKKGECITCKNIRIN